MVIRNPYSFVVKHYKLINILLMIPLIYLIFKFGDVASFFKDYISNGYRTNETNFVDSYITGLTTISIIFMIVANTILYLLFSSKRKGGLYYEINAIYFAVLLVGTFLFSASMSSIEKNTLDLTFANFVRDVSVICYFPMYLIVAINTSKAFGFNFRTLQFDNNSELKIKEDEDDEEIEIKLGSDNNTIKKNFVGMVRELKYYILENKFVFSVIGIILFAIFSYVTYTNYQLYNRTYGPNQSFSFENFTIALKDSYITDTDYRGTLIAEGKYYLAIRIGLENNSMDDTAISSSHFRLYDGKDFYYPSYDKSSRFIDIGEAYQGEPIIAGTSHEYVFVYELTAEQVKNTYQLRILNNFTEKNGKLLTSYKKITVKPRNITKVYDLGVLKMNEEVTFKDTTLGESKIMIKNLSLATSYRYTYQNCDSKNVCSDIKDTVTPSAGNVLLIIDDEITIDETVPYSKYKYQDFYIDYSYFVYQFKMDIGIDEGKKNVSTTMKNITPKVVNDVKIYEVPYTMLNAEKINLRIRIRNKYMTIVIRE